MKAVAFPFVGGSDELKRKKFDVQRTVNMFPADIESGTGKSKRFLQSVPGLTVFTVSTLGIVKTQALDTAAVGDTQTYTITATNLGPESADGATVRDILPDAFSFASCSVSYSGGAAGPATASEATLAAGITVTTWPNGGVVTVVVVGVLTAEGEVLNTAVASIPGLAATTVQSTTTTTVTPPAACDPYFNNVVLLLHGRGDDGSATITDSSKYLDHKTAPAGLTISNDAFKFGTTSLKVTYQNIGDFFWESTRFIRSSGVPYTIEFWFKHVSSQNTTSSPLIYRHMNDATVQTQVSQYSTGSTVQLFTGGGPESPVSYTADADGWVFGAIAYDGVSSATLYIQGIAAAVYGGAGTAATTSKFYVLGFGGVGTEPVEFYLQELRVTNGVNRYPANFTPPTEPFPDIECA